MLFIEYVQMRITTMNLTLPGAAERNLFWGGAKF